MQPKLPHQFFPLGLYVLLADQATHIGLAILLGEGGFDVIDNGYAKQVDQGGAVQIVEDWGKVHGCGLDDVGPGEYFAD